MHTTGRTISATVENCHRENRPLAERIVDETCSISSATIRAGKPTLFFYETTRRSGASVPPRNRCTICRSCGPHDVPSLREVFSTKTQRMRSSARRVSRALEVSERIGAMVRNDRRDATVPSAITFSQHRVHTPISQRDSKIQQSSAVRLASSRKISPSNRFGAVRKRWFEVQGSCARNGENSGNRCWVRACHGRAYGGD